MYFSLKKNVIDNVLFYCRKMFDLWIIYVYFFFVFFKKKVKIKVNFDIMLLRIECDRFFYFIYF